MTTAAFSRHGVDGRDNPRIKSGDGHDRKRVGVAAENAD
jgi:hypothetical protein